MRKKITLIGAGSVVFAKKLIGDILQFEALADSEICLMDIDPKRLKVAEAMTRKTVSALGTGASVSATTDRVEAVRGASYVICTIQVGGYKPSTVVDFEIPAKYGLQQTIADTLGVGGVFRALRTIPHIVAIAEDIKAHAKPGCLLLNYSNPMAMNCWAIDKATGIPHVGLCHSVQGTSKQLADYAGLDYSDVTYKVAGINHMAFFLEYKYRGQDAYPLLFKALEDPSVAAQDKVRFEMMRRLGYFVTESSEHQAEYVPYFIHHGQKVIDEFLIPIDEYRRRCEAIIATWQQQEKDLLGEGEGKEFTVSPQSHEYGSYIIYASETNEPTVVYGNVPNRDLISNLPNGCCVELPCLVDANGVQPTRIGDLPPQLAAICRTNVNVQELTVEAALTGKREHIYHAVMMDPHAAATLTLDQIWSMCDEMIEAHQKDGYLGEFAPVIKNTGRSLAGTGDRAMARLETLDSFSFEKGAQNTIKLVASNPSQKKLAAEFAVSASSNSVEGKTVRLEVPAGSEASREVQVTLRERIDELLKLDLNSDSEEVLCQGLSIAPRRSLERNGTGASKAELQLAGNDAVSCSLQKNGETLRCSFKVLDSDIKRAESSNMAIRLGSALELFVAPDEKSPVNCVRIFPAPRNSDLQTEVRTPLGKPVQGAKASQETTEIDYRIDLELPLAAIGLKPDSQTALIDIRAHLNALGDAHSGGKTSLSGRMGRHGNLPYFHQLNL